jgi:hypothetical protein
MKIGKYIFINKKRKTIKKIKIIKIKNKKQTIKKIKKEKIKKKTKKLFYCIICSSE